VNPISSLAIDIPHSLLAQAKAGDHAAFERIYRLFERPVYTLCLRLTGDRSLAQDALQESMFRVFDRIAEYRADAPFWAWLRQVSVNEALMLMRKRRRLQELASDSTETELSVADCEISNSALSNKNLLAAIQQLPSVTRSVLWLYHVEGYTHEEISHSMDRTVSFSKSQLARGTQKLRQLLQVAEFSHA